MSKTKTFNMRFYASELYGNNTLYLNQLLDKYADNTGKIVTPIVQFGDYAYRVIIDASNVNTNECYLSGYFATYREESITKGSKSTGVENLIPFSTDEAIVEKSYFSLFYSPSSEVLIFQNTRYGRINDLKNYIHDILKTLKIDGWIYLAEIGADKFDINKILNQKPQYVEYRLAKPRTKYNPSDLPVWEQQQFEMMENTGARSFTAKLSTRASGGLNRAAMTRLLEEIQESDNIRKCKIKIEDIDTPIDLLADVLKADFTITPTRNGTINEFEIFSKIRGLREQFAILQNYL